MNSRWCEHDEVASACLECRLRLALLRNELLEIRLGRVFELARQISNEIENDTAPGHPLRRVAEQLQSLMQGEPDEAEQACDVHQRGDRHI